MSFDPIASFTRRKFIAGSAAVAAVAFVRDVHAQAPSGPFKLDPLPYPNNALEPHIDARTMEIHHDRHHAAYVTNLNNAVKDHSNVAAITRDLGGLQKLQDDFNAAGLRVFGSGWAFISVTPDGKLALETKPNQDTPLMESKRVLFGNDVWEHAYYLSYQNRRADYLKAWWNVVNWGKVGERYAAAKARTLTI